MEDFSIIPDTYDPESDAAEIPAIAPTDTPPLTIDSRPAVAWSRPLLFPFKVDGRLMREVTLQHPAQGDIDDFASGELKTLRQVLCRLTGLHPDAIRTLKWPDSEALHLAFKDVLPSFLIEEVETHG